MQNLSEIVALLRTGLPPESWGMTNEQWLQHKCNKAAAELQAIIDSPAPLRVVHDCCTINDLDKRGFTCLGCNEELKWDGLVLINI